jgi:hypothetical protein
MVAAAGADILEFNFVLQPQQEVPPNNSNAAGSAQLLYDTATQTYDLDVMVFGIGIGDLMGAGGNGTPIHIHEAPMGVNGPIRVDVGFVSSFAPSGQGIRLMVDDGPFGGQQGNIFSDPNLNEAALLAGNMYLNVHTQSFPGGQIRGQIVPEPASMLLLASAGLALAGRRRG